MTLPAVETFRAQVRARRFPCMSDADLAKVRRKFLNADHSNRIEGIIPSEETRALFDVLLEERVPAQEWTDLVLGFMEHQPIEKSRVA